MDIVLASEIAGILSAIVLLISIFTRKEPHNLLELNLSDNFKALVWLTFLGWLTIIIVMGNLMIDSNDSIFKQGLGTISFMLLMMITPFLLLLKFEDKPLLLFTVYLCIIPILIIILIYLFGEKTLDTTSIYIMLFFIPFLALLALSFHKNK